MTVKSLHIYPIKGLGGIELQDSLLLERGMEYDRRWMLVDMNGDFITQRTTAQLALFECSMDSELHVTFGHGNISINMNECSDEKVLTYVWESEVYTYEVNSVISGWFTEQLGIACRLVKMVKGYDRFKKLIKGPEQTKVSFADGYPYSIIGTASLEELNERLGKELPSNRFRANIIVETSIAHQEDTWDVIQIGEAKLQVIKACARCLVINIDQSSAKKKKQPLKELANYRARENEVYFGANTICLKEGRINVGDKLHLMG